MKRTFWKTAFCCGLALSLSSVGQPARGFAETDETDLTVAQVRKGEGKPPGGAKGGGKPPSGAKPGGGSQGGGRPQGGAKAGGKPPSGAKAGGGSQGGGRPQGGAKAGGKPPSGAKPQGGGGTRTQPSRGGTVPHFSGGGIHAPAIAGPRHAPGNGGQPPVIKRTPSFGRPNIGGLQQTRQPRTVPQQGQRSGITQGRAPGGGSSGSIRSGNQGVQIGVRDQAGTRQPNSNHSAIVNQPFTGNTAQLRNKQVNLGHSSYQPAYYRHSGYHGYWNGNRGYSGSSNTGSGSRSGSRSGIGINIGGTSIGINLGSGFGLGSNLGYGGGYGPGWGWGLGNGYGYGGYSGYGGYGYRPFGWGLGGWGLGSLIYNSGYLGYSNPYYLNSYGLIGNYSYAQPVPVAYNTTVVVGQNDPNSADVVLNNAVAAFQQNDYDAALDIINKGIAQYPDDAVLHEFRALVLFARQDYQQAASTIHSVLAVGPGWDWTTLSSMYFSVAIYTEQLRALEAFTGANPQDAASRFLLAYHYMSCGYPDAATRQLQQVVKLMPNDRVASDLLAMLAAPQPAEPAQQPTPQPAQEPTRPAATPIDPAMLIGTWKAARDDGSQFNLTLTNDAKFIWSFAPKGQAPQEFGGTYTVDGNVLALERTGGGSLIAEVTPGSAEHFNFRMVGAPQEDPGLNFSK